MEVSFKGFFPLLFSSFDSWIGQVPKLYSRSTQQKLWKDQEKGVSVSQRVWGEIPGVFSSQPGPKASPRNKPLTKPWVTCAQYSGGATYTSSPEELRTKKRNSCGQKTTWEESYYFLLSFLSLLTPSAKLQLQKVYDSTWGKKGRGSREVWLKL